MLTPSETAAVAAVSLTFTMNVVALVWGAAKLSAKVDKISDTAREIKEEFRSFLIEHKKLERQVGNHSTAIALLAREVNLRIRHDDVEEGDRP